VAFWVVGVLPPAPFWHKQDAYMAILGVAPRIALASLTAYFCGEFVKSVTLSKMKFAQAGRRGIVQAWRFVASSAAGEFVDSVVFMLVAFAGVLATADMATTILTLWRCRSACGLRTGSKKSRAWTKLTGRRRRITTRSRVS